LIYQQYALIQEKKLDTRLAVWGLDIRLSSLPHWYSSRRQRV